jgi:sigma-B regulation protein RsbU (phosphoserine phosphatase)
MQINAFNIALKEGLQELMEKRSLPGNAEIKRKLDEDSRYVLSAYPSASIVLNFQNPVSGQSVSYINQNFESIKRDTYQIPEWLSSREFRGLAIDDVQSGKAEGKLYIKSFVYSDILPDLPFSLEISVPIDRFFLGRLKDALGQNLLLAHNVEHSIIKVMPQSARELRAKIVESTYNAEAGAVWPIPLFPVSWKSGKEIDYRDAGILFWVELSTSRLAQNLFRSESIQYVGKIILIILGVIAAIFLISEIVSIFIGIKLTRSITNAVQNLDQGTEFVKRGDFSHRINVKSNDQLGALASSFNQMTEYVQLLVKERVKKERLEREIEIAKEVQERLFPSSAPQMEHMSLTGVCLPARMVSGDYYDFLPLGLHELGLAIGDICGKGISAALLMTNLQATLRSNVLHQSGQSGANGNKSVASLVEKVNAQIHSYTSDNKFASFFYAIYDDGQKSLTYCNAGHNPPLFFTNGGVRRLTVGGTVVGIFADSQYEQETMQANPGDLFLAYTDGIIECTNEFGEEFGENRLIEVTQQCRDLSVEEIKEKIVEQVLSWSSSEERSDDMTLVVAKIT